MYSNKRTVLGRIQGLYVAVVMLFLATTTGFYAKAQSLQDGLVGWYTFENTPEDGSGNGYTGTCIGGATYAPDGKVGSALSIPGYGASFQVPDNPDYDLSGGGYALSLWVNLSYWTGWPGIGGSIVHNHRAHDDGNSWMLTANTNNRFCLLSFTSPAIGGETVILPNTWYHVVVTGSQTENVTRIYVNGNLDVESSFIPLIANGYPLLVGHDNGYVDYRVQGLIDELRFYNRFLSFEEVQQLFAQGNYVVSILTPSSLPATVFVGQACEFRCSVAGAGSLDMVTSVVLQNTATGTIQTVPMAYTGIDDAMHKIYAVSYQFTEPGNYDVSYKTENTLWDILAELAVGRVEAKEAEFTFFVNETTPTENLLIRFTS